MKALACVILLCPVLVAIVPRPAAAQNSAPCPDTHYLCSPGVCCPR